MSWMARLALSTLIAALVPTAAPVAAAPGDGAIAGRLTEVGTGDALPDLCVRAYDASLGRIDSETVSDGEDTTSTNGRYRVTGLDPADEYKLFFGCDFAPEREKHIVEWFSNRSSYRRADPVPVLPGQTTEDIDASLRLGGVISGHVRPSRGHVGTRGTHEVDGTTRAEHANRGTGDDRGSGRCRPG